MCISYCCEDITKHAYSSDGSSVEPQIHSHLCTRYIYGGKILWYTARHKIKLAVCQSHNGKVFRPYIRSASHISSSNVKEISQRCSSSLKMNAVYSSETMVTTPPTTWCHNTDDHNVNVKTGIVTHPRIGGTIQFLM
jgi:hypothetical protein